MALLKSIEGVNKKNVEGLNAKINFGFNILVVVVFWLYIHVVVKNFVIKSYLCYVLDHSKIKLIRALQGVKYQILLRQK